MGLSIDEALNTVGFGKFQWTLLLLSGIGFFATTVELVGLTLLRGPILQEWKHYVDNRKFGYLVSATFAGELIGGLAWGWLCDRVGRRFVYVSTAGMAALFGMLGSIVPCLYTLTIVRFFLGIAIGGCLSIDFLYFVEFVPAASRGFRSTFIILLGITAFFYVSLVGWLTLPAWRRFIFWTGFPYGLLFVGRLLWRWETPRFLLSKGKVNEAKRVLADMARINGSKIAIHEIDLLEEITLISSQTPSPTLTSSPASPVSSSYYLDLSLASLLFFCQTFSYYGLTIWLRAFATARNIPSLNIYLNFILIGLSELPGLAVATLLIDRLGRRRLLIITFLGSAASSLSLLLPFNHAYLFHLITAVSYFFIVGTWAAIYILTPELFPTHLRARSFSIAGSFGKLAGMTGPHLFGSFWDQKVSLAVIVAFVSGPFLIGAVASLLFLRETKNKPLM